MTNNIPTQTLTAQLLSEIFHEYTVKKLNNWKFSLQRSYYYSPKAGLEGFIENVKEGFFRETFSNCWSIVEASDNFRAWPKLSYYEVIIHINDVSFLFDGRHEDAWRAALPTSPTVKEAAPALTTEAVEEVDPVLAKLIGTTDTRKIFRAEVRKFIAKVEATYELEDGCYIVYLPSGASYSISREEETGKTVVKKI